MNHGFKLYIVISLTVAINLGTSKNYWRHFKLSVLRYCYNKYYLEFDMNSRIYTYFGVFSAPSKKKRKKE